MKEKKTFKIPHPVQYWFISFFLWIIVDYTSTFMPHTTQWISLMPFIWIFYIGIPAIMAFVIYKFTLTGKSLLYVTLIELVIVELLFQSDLFTIPVVFFMLPIAIVLYSLLTIVPFWIVEHNVVQNKGKVIVLVAVWLLFSVFRFFDQIGYAETSNRLVPTSLSYPEGTQHEAPLLMVHYMSWFTTKPVSGQWALWVMKNRNPENIDETGRHEIASHFYPITGPYDLSDPDILEYHVLLMKLSGIDGIIVNWPGIINQGLLARDPVTKALRFATENARNIIEYCKRAGLQFALNFEDWQPLRISKIPIIGGRRKALALTRQMICYADDLWLHDPAYITVNGQPLFTFFGPFFVTNRQDFHSLFADLHTPPLVLTVIPRFEDIGQFYWMPVGPGTNREVSRQELEAHMQHFQQRAAQWPYRIAGATPGFHDYWVEGGEHAESFGFIAYDNGETLRWTLDKALESSPDMIQIITWNDFAEGTMIEPTHEFGTTFLEILQEFNRTHRNPAFSYSAEDLQIPFQLYTLRKTYAHDEEIQTWLDSVFALIVRDDLRGAVDILNTIEPRSTSTSP